MLFLNRRSISAALALWLAGGLPLAHAGAHTPSGTGQIRPALLYHNYCSVCHGDKGDGRSRAEHSLVPPPRNFTSPAAAQELSRARMLDGVRNGRPGTAMTAWKGQLSEPEIEALVDYMRDTFMLPSSSADGSRGRVVYSKNCSVCHGDKGDGRSRAQGSLMPPPRDFTSAAARAELNAQRMITSVTYGRADTAMAGFKSQLSEADISAVVDYIRAGFMNIHEIEGVSGIRNGRRTAQPAEPTASANPSAGATPAAPAVAVAKAVDMRLPLPQGLKGDPVKGGAFYMSNCATCHGTTGDGRGPRAYFINPKPRNFLHTASRQELNRPALYQAISAGRLGTEMPAWNKVLEKQEIADVSEFVFRRFIEAPAKK